MCSNVFTLLVQKTIKYETEVNSVERVIIQNVQVDIIIILVAIAVSFGGERTNTVTHN